MSELDYQLLEQRRSCALLTREERLTGKVPTTPTTAAIIAGIQVQEAVKWLHRDRHLPTLTGKGFLFNGLTHDSYVVTYQRRGDCPAHDTFPQVLPTEFSADTPAREILAFVRQEVSPQAVVDLSREVCIGIVCRKCNERIELFRSLGKVTEEEARCPKCGEIGEPEMLHSLYGDEPFLDKTLAELGVPPYDIFTGREGLEMQHFLLSADRDKALGKIA
jgi:adenylyltransferase/sulfurtransferase